MNRVWTILLGALLVFLPAASSGSATPVKAPCSRCGCCVQPNRNSLPRQTIPGPTARSVSLERFADEVDPAIVAPVPQFEGAEHFVAATNLRGFAASPLFERYCVLLI